MIHNATNILIDVSFFDFNEFMQHLFTNQIFLIRRNIFSACEIIIFIMTKILGLPNLY